MLPLEGLKVLDLSRLLPGPYATLVLADLGATVDKVEDPQGGDYLRQTPPMKGDESAPFMALNRNKRSITIDLKSPAGVKTFKKLVREYDVLLESFRPGVMDKLGVGWEVLREENPKLIYCAISGYGQTGPDRLKAGHDLNYIARSGFLAYGGEAGGAVATPGGQVADIGGGALFSLVGILAALYERQRTGVGRFLDVSMTEGAMAFVHMHLASRLLLGAEGKPLARGAEALNGGYACYRVYRCQDGRSLSVGSLEPKFLLGLSEALGKPELAGQAYDLEGGGALKARAMLEELFATRPLAAWVELFKDKDLCVEPVLEGDEVLEDPQLKARGVFIRKGSDVHLRTPLDFGPVPLRPAPKLGQHTQEILGALPK